ncbi:dihydropteroate synthase [Allostreptomyces psammosilenae]|uniref:Dihydropteroate synthase n=2 Tax=Allostreptomyces psammosilenae TaxID=1892865 RepID=A0A852ZTL8_9ACTN|nr:dihydropteroate synthase [Allostreptomyces psammosilenae]
MTVTADPHGAPVQARPAAWAGVPADNQAGHGPASGHPGVEHGQAAGTAPEARPHPRPGHVVGLPEYGRCAVMGVVNVTPDSFSDGGRWFDTDAAVAHGLELLEQGADLIDVGGESTRPGASRVSEAEELRRVLPVVRELAAAGAVLSVDTMRARVASAALESGARLVNDVSGGLADPAMLRVVAETGAPFVVMHWRGQSVDMQSRAVYDDPRGTAAQVADELRRRLDEVVAAGIDPERTVLDPGLGFAKTAEHNWQLLAGLDRLLALGRPVLVAASRKGFLGKLLADGEGNPRPAAGRDAATAAISALAADRGAWAVRVHDVPPTADAVRVAAAIRGAAR